MVTFNEIPVDTLTPFMFVEFGRGNTPSTSTAINGLLIGQGIEITNDSKIIKVLSSDEAGVKFGQGSNLHRMAIKYYENNQGEISCISIPKTGTSGAGEVVVTGTATESGELALYIGSDKVGVSVDKGDTVTTVNNDIVSTINGNTSLPVTASIDGVKVKLTAKASGSIGHYPLQKNYNNEEDVAGVTVSFTAMSGGGGSVDLGTITPIIGDTEYHLIATCYNDRTNLGKLDTFLAGRFQAMKMITGIGVSVFSGTVGALTTEGDHYNTKHICLIDGNRKNPDHEILGAFMGVAIKSLSSHPARPLQTLKLKGILTKDNADRFSRVERNTLLKNGVATLLDSDNGLLIERILTTYKKTSSGVADDTWRDLNDVVTASYIRTDFVNLIRNKYPNHLLGEDGGSYDPSVPVVTPITFQAEFLGKYEEWEKKGFVQGFEEIKEKITVTKNGDAIEFQSSANLINQLRLVKGKILI